MADSDNRNSLLSYIVDEFTNQTELVATKALAYILGRSPAARDALRELLRTGGADVGPIVGVEAESTGDDTGRVDLALRNDVGEERVLIEAKFWACLTGNQPAAYLERLPNDGKPSVLLFVAPEMRLGTLWPLIRGRAKDDGFTLVDGSKTDYLQTAAVAESNRFLMLTSWRAMLSDMRLRASVNSDAPAEADILQLNALCERRDTEAFLPIRAGEFGPDFPRRIRDLWRLIDNAPEIAEQKGFVSVKGFNKQAGFGRRLRMRSAEKGVWAYAWFGVDDTGTLEDHPLVLNFYEDVGGMSLTEVERRLGYTRIPVDLLHGEEYDAVRDDVVGTLQWFARRLSGEVDDDEWKSKWPGNLPRR